MGWIIDASGSIGRGSVEAELWGAMKALGQASHMALAGAYIVVIARFLKLCASWNQDRRLSEPLRQLSALLCFCALAHAGDAVATYLAEQRIVSLPSVFAAVFASVAAWKVAQYAGGAWDVEDKGGESGLFRIVGAGPSPEAARPADDGAPHPERQEWLKLRVNRLEDLARRNAWLLQRREAVDRLGSMLSEGDRARQAEPEHASAGSARGGEGTERGGSASLA